jgi:hypothetical protein
MRITLIAQDHLFKSGLESGLINGGTAWLFHVAAALYRHNNFEHSVQMIDYEAPIGEADLYIIQSEWYAHASHIEEFRRARDRGAKVVVILGHFIGGNYFPPEQIEADVFVSTWLGPVVEDFEARTGKVVHYWPHAYGEDSGNTIMSGTSPIVFAGNTFPLRDESVLKDLEVTYLKGIHPSDLPGYYRGASICLNFHGAFQDGVVSDHPSAIAHLPGYALNERTFQVMGSGGFLLCQVHSLLAKTFDLGNIATFTDAADLRKKIDYYLARPEERQEMAERGRAMILAEHTYAHRVIDLLSWI